MLKIGLLGYGKMGKAIELLAESQGIEIVWRISRENMQARKADLLRKADVVIEFSRPEAAYENVMACLEAGVPVVSGTTGWAEELPKAHEFCKKIGGTLIWASNFSIGVNMFFALNRYLAVLMGQREEYRPALSETHHIHKLDAPSGTAITLAKDLLEIAPRFTSYKLLPENSGETIPAEMLPITAHRVGEVPGTHEITWRSPVDSISIEHRANSREGFALGAIAAAKWVHGKHGVFTMNDVLNIQ
jgi:4-hydroxy-tetrahydrodipicolinate reductase